MSSSHELHDAVILNHWGLTRLPFGKITRDGDVFQSTVHSQHMNRLKQVLQTREIGVVMGEAGTGKSTLLQSIRKLASRSFRVIQLDAPPMKVQALYQDLSHALGLDVTLRGANALKVRHLLSYSYVESNRPNLLLLDEAHSLPKPILEELRILTDTTVKSEPIVAMVLFGQPLLTTILQSPALIPLAQRIQSWVTTSCLTETDGVAYINWHLTTAGGSAGQFTEAAKLSIIRSVGGNYRLANRLAWECLNQGVLDDAHTVTEELVSHLCKELNHK